MFETVKAEIEPIEAEIVVPSAPTAPAVLKADVISSTAVTTGNTMGRTSSKPPGNCKDGGVWGTTKYIGETTKAIACLSCLCCGIFGCCVLLCPQDEKDAYCVEGKVYDASGKFIANRQGDNFIPKRRR